MDCRSTQSGAHSEGGPTPACDMQVPAQVEAYLCGRDVDILHCSGRDDLCKSNIKSFKLFFLCNLILIIPEFEDICAGDQVVKDKGSREK